MRRMTAGACLLCLCLAHASQAAEPQERYYAYPAVEDAYGVIAPWYKGLNGQCDFRVRIAAEAIKRYPWAEPPKAPSPAPDYVYSGHWRIADDGTITIPELSDWNNGDLGQRAAYTLFALIDYYRYSGDPAAIAHMSILANTVLDHCQTGADHPWPRFLISAPTKGKPYGQCDPHGMIQLDITAQVGLGLVQAYELAGNTRWLDAAKHWADLLAAKRSRDPKQPPWNRYANPEDVRWEDHQTGGVVLILRFLEELIRVGYTGSGNSIVEARDAGRDYLRSLLARWTAQDVWGRHYWDWPHPVQGEICTEAVARYLMENQDLFPNWQVDVRNILSLFLTRASVSPRSDGDVYSGAWAYPEGPGCCDRSLWYAPLQLVTVFAQYGVQADSEWARELARRQVILATYDCHETGVVEDNIDGGQIVAGSWFKITHPMALAHVLRTMAWLPEQLGANRENHIMRSSAVVTRVVYGKGRIAYSTFDAPPRTVDVLRLAFRPTAVTTDGRPLAESSTLDVNGYTVRELSNGDCIVAIRHDGHRSIVVEGDDLQEVADDHQLTFTGNWGKNEHKDHFRGAARVASAAGAAITFTFDGSQVRLIGSVGPAGGKAEVYLDDVQQLVGIDCWNPYPLQQQVLYYNSGLSGGKHTLKVVFRGDKNPLSRNSNVCVDAVQFSAATGEAGFGEGGGPTDTQRWIFGYTGRADYVDSRGHTWRPATEVVIRLGHMVDPVATSWYTTRRRLAVAGTDDPELYRYGMHGKDFTAYFTVAPGKYHVRLKFMETRNIKPELRAINVYINGKQVVSNVDIAATARGVDQAEVKAQSDSIPRGQGLNSAVDLVFNDVQPASGVIAVRFTGAGDGEAIISAIEVGPGPGGEGAKPVALTQPAK